MRRAREAVRPPVVETRVRARTLRHHKVLVPRDDTRSVEGDALSRVVVEAPAETVARQRGARRVAQATQEEMQEQERRAGALCRHLVVLGRRELKANINKGSKIYGMESIHHTRDAVGGFNDATCERECSLMTLSFHLICGLHTVCIYVCGALQILNQTTPSNQNNHSSDRADIMPCASAFDCGGLNGRCLANSTCACSPGWQGANCAALKFVPSSARVAFPTALWTWGGSPIVDDGGVYHLFASEMSNLCGILHYCVNSRVIHLVSPNATGPYERREIALAPRRREWDNGAVHGISVHRLPNKTYALLYMGSMQPALSHQPNCTPGSNDSSANTTLGSRAGRRIGVATAETLSGPWRRQHSPLFGPDAAAWDDIDVSNPSPIIAKDGSIVMLYKGRGRHTQHVGLAFAPAIDGPYTRNNSSATVPTCPARTRMGGSTRRPACTMRCSTTATAPRRRGGTGGAATESTGQGGAPHIDDLAYTGAMAWANDSAVSPARHGRASVLARRERPQVLLGGTAGGSAGSSYGHPTVLFTSAQDCIVHGVDAGRGIPCRAAAIETWRDPVGARVSGGAGHYTGTDMSYTVLEEVDVG